MTEEHILVVITLLYVVIGFSSIGIAACYNRSATVGFLLVGCGVLMIVMGGRFARLALASVIGH